MSRRPWTKLLRLIAQACAAFIVADASAAPTLTGKRASAIAEIASLDGAMPSSFDLYPADPCGGVWDVRLRGVTAMKLIVYRYRNLPLINVRGSGFGASNNSITRVDPHSIKVNLPRATRIVLRCANARAVVELTPVGETAPTILNAVPGDLPVPPTAPWAEAAAQPSVHEQAGNIVYVAADGAKRVLTDNGNNSDPVLSPDGRTVVYVHLDGQPTEEGEAGFTSLWRLDVALGERQRVLASAPHEEPKRNLASFGSPRFSLDGGFIYIEAQAWATSTAIHQVSFATGAARFVTDGWLLRVIRNGPYRGYLIVGQHRYYDRPEGGSYNPLSVVRPDGTEVMMVLGSDADDYDAEQQLPRWLRSDVLP